MPWFDAATPFATNESVGAGRGQRLTQVAAFTLLLTWAFDAARVTADPEHPEPRFAVADRGRAAFGIPTFTEVARHSIPVPPGKPSSHASSLVAVTDHAGNRTLLAFWFAGSRESGPDVEIISSRFDLAAMRWSAPRVAINRELLAGELAFSVRRLGNAVAWADRAGRVHLFAVATGLGGWSASRVVHLTSDDAGESFEARRVLPLSPWFNTGALVRAPAVPLADGGALLPMYFEFGNKYPIAMRVTPQGDPIAIVRMSNDDEALQPTIVPLDALRAVALLRDHGSSRTMKLVSTRDGGLSWVDERPTNMANPNSPVAGTRLPGGALLAVLNPFPRGRHELVIAVSRSGYDWTIVNEVASGEEHEEFSYPALLTEGGFLHLTYTDRRRGISHRVYRIGALQ